MRLKKAEELTGGKIGHNFKNTKEGTQLSGEGLGYSFVSLLQNAKEVIFSFYSMHSVFVFHIYGFVSSRPRHLRQ